MQVNETSMASVLVILMTFGLSFAAKALKSTHHGHARAMPSSLKA
jgi:hypothetical protein